MKEKTIAEILNINHRAIKHNTGSIFILAIAVLLNYLADIFIK